MNRHEGDCIGYSEADDDEAEESIDKISYAIAGPGASIMRKGSVELRGVSCVEYIIAGYLTVASDEYGYYYIKDLPQDGFYRLSLNPSGSWSKSEKISLGEQISGIE